MNSIFFLTIFVVYVVVPYKFPEKLERCHKNDAELDKCLKTSIQNALQLIGSTGIPSLNLAPIDPIEIIKLEIGAGSGAVNLVQKYSNIKLYGLSKSTVENAHLDIDKKILTFTVNVPRIDQKAKYDMNGKVLVMPFVGKGDSVISLLDVTIISVINFEEETKNSKLYFKITSYKATINIKGAHYQFDNLFNGDQQLSANIHKVLNDNWKDIYDDVKGGTESSYGEIFKGLATRLFNSVPIEEIFLN